MRQKNGQETPLVSVIMPVYNASKFLKQAVESVLNQTYGNIELIMVDDCSTDGSLEIMREYEKADDRVRVVRNEKNQGVARVRNRGIQLAKGEYIALLDSDDVWLEAKLEIQIDQLMRTGADLAYCSMKFIDESGNETKRPFIAPAETNYKQMLAKNVIVCSTVVIRAELMKEHLFNAEYYHEDYALWMQLMALPIKAVGSAEILAYYRQVSGSRSNNKLNAAKHRWKLYREALGMNIFQASTAFVKYAFWGAWKHWLPIGKHFMKA